MSKALRPVLVIGTLAAGVLVAAHPAGAAVVDGELAIKGPGSLYTGGTSDSAVSLAVAAGTTATFSLKVVNTGTDVTQYNLRLAMLGKPAAVSVVSGAIVVDDLAQSSNGYITDPLLPGKAQTFAVKVTPPKGTTQGSTTAGFALYDLAGNQLNGAALAVTEIAGPAHGTTSAQIYARQGGQKFVGGDNALHLATAPSFARTGSAAFAVRLQNDSAVAAAIGLTTTVEGDCPGAFTVTYKVGSIDVTAAVVGGTYTTGSVAPAGHKDITVTVRHPGPLTTCNGARIQITSHLGGAGGPVGQHLLFLLANTIAI